MKNDTAPQVNTMDATAEQQAYRVAKARFDRIDAERDRILAPIFDGAPGAPEDDVEVRRQINTDLGYREAYDALYAATMNLLAWAAGWVRTHPAYLARHPAYGLLLGPIPVGGWDEALDLAARWIQPTGQVAICRPYKTKEATCNATRQSSRKEAHDEPGHRDTSGGRGHVSAGVMRLLDAEVMEYITRDELEALQHARLELAAYKRAVRAHGVAIDEQTFADARLRTWAEVEAVPIADLPELPAPYHSQSLAVYAMLADLIAGRVGARRTVTEKAADGATRDRMSPG